MVSATFIFETAPPQPTTFSFTNLLIAAVVLAIAYPLVSRLRKRVSDSRRERWAREEGRHEDRIGSDDSGAQRERPEED